SLQDLLDQESIESFSTLVREMLKGNAGRGVQQALLARVNELRNVHLEAKRGAWNFLVPGEPTGEQALAGAVAALEQMELPKTKAGTPVKPWVTARQNLLRFVSNGKWEAICLVGFGKCFFTGATSYYSHPIDEEFRALLTPIMNQVRFEVLSLLVARTSATSEFLDSFEISYQKRKRSTGAYGFEDLPHALAPNTANALPIDERELDMWFRLDGRIDHLLLDEFQDTSPVQWRILAPIAEEITAEGDGSRSFFCVGDAKQSIYSFRQAEPRLLTNLNQLLPALPAPESMVKSYRSSKVVLDTVNLVFEELVNSPVFAHEDHAAHRKGCEDFSRSFATHEAAKDLPGAAFLIEARGPQDEDASYTKADESRLVQERLLERVQLILEESPNASIGILTRTGKVIPAIIHSLRDAGIDASGEGGNVLTDARSVVVMLSILHLADFPDDSAAAFHVGNSAFGVFLGLGPNCDAKERRAKSLELRTSFASLGLASFVSRFHEQVSRDGSWSAWDRARFSQLHDVAFAFEASGEVRPSAFIDHIRVHRVENPGGAAVRVMTIHGSKGLEFEAVLLPEIGGNFASMPPKVLVDRPEPQQLIQRACIPPNKDFNGVAKELQDLYQQDRARAVADDLCVLYVAMTRAARRLELILPVVMPPKSGSKSKAPSMALLLRQRLSTEGNEPGEDGVLWSHEDNSKAWHKSEQQSAPSAPTRAPSLALKLAPTSQQRSMPRRRPSSEEGGGQRSIADAMRSSKGADIGTLTHAILEGLEWSETFDPLAALEHSLLRRAKQEDRDQAAALASRAMESNTIMEALAEGHCRAPAGTEREVLREPKFSLHMEGSLWSSAIDRLVLAREGERVVWAEITDYKTDSVKGDNLHALVDHYRPQLERYAQLIGEIYGLQREAILCRLIFLGAGEVCEV
ncbi:MAG: ATP-dependent helicase/nuclease subunit A, partial [Candidatus Paceibacteria bacterium]